MKFENAQIHLSGSNEVIPSTSESVTVHVLDHGYVQIRDDDADVMAEWEPTTDAITYSLAAVEKIVTFD